MRLLARMMILESMTDRTVNDAAPDACQLDRAHEWVSENHPEAEGADYEAHLAAALADILAIDAAADRADGASK